MSRENTILAIREVIRGVADEIYRFNQFAMEHSDLELPKLEAKWVEDDADVILRQDSNDPLVEIRLAGNVLVEGSIVFLDQFSNDADPIPYCYWASFIETKAASNIGWIADSRRREISNSNQLQEVVFDTRTKLLREFMGAAWSNHFRTLIDQQLQKTEASEEGESLSM